MVPIDVIYIKENLTTTTSLNAGSTQDSNYRLLHPAYSVGSLTLVKIAGKGASGNPRVKIDNPTKDQGEEGVS
jgi:hypothetical protein